MPGPILARLIQIRATNFFFVGFTFTCWRLSQATIVFNFKENLWSKLKKMIKKKLILGLI